MTLGLKFEPLKGLSAGLDYWAVKMKHQIVSLPATLVFGNPTAYDSLIRTVYDPARGSGKLAALLPSDNLGRSNFSGVDWELAYARKLEGLGRLALSWSGTYMPKLEIDDGAGHVENSVAASMPTTP